MIDYLIIFVLQVVFNISKVNEIKYTYENKIPQLLINSIWINLISLGSMFYSLERMFKGDWIIVIFYVAGSVLGKWIGMKKEKFIKNIF